ncbi:MAG: hypothetical protein NVS4B2_26840 [Chloroflexota bacterium]
MPGYHSRLTRRRVRPVVHVTACARIPAAALQGLKGKDGDDAWARKPDRHGTNAGTLYTRSQTRCGDSYIGRIAMTGETPMPVLTTGFAHVRLTVTDIARSRAFYDDLFAFPVAIEEPPNADDETRRALGFLYGGVIYQVGSALLGLRPVAPGTDRFDEDRVGLDHLSFSVANRDDLEAAATLLDDRGILHAGIKDIGGGFILEFRDPDGIALELFAPAVSPSIHSL